MASIQSEDIFDLIEKDQSHRVIKYSLHDGIGILKIDTPNSKVNTLGQQIMDEVQENMNLVRNLPQVRAVVLLSGKPDTFIVGADINMLAKCQTAEEATQLSRTGQELLKLIEEYPKPIVVGIHGMCLGGGLEVALACHYRLAVANKKTLLGLPEVMLGLVPGLGGTQRLPRTVLLHDALDMLLMGRKVRTERAKDVGLVDVVVPACDSDEDTCKCLEIEAIKAAKDLETGRLVIRRSRPLLQRLTEYALGYQFVRNLILERSKKEVLKFSLGLYPAPLRLIEVVKKGLDEGAEVGYRAEAEAFGQLTQTSQSKALFSLFHGQTECKKNRVGVEPPHEVKNLAILGTGVMACGIAVASLDRGFRVTVKGRSYESLHHALVKIKKGYDGALKRKRITASERDTYLSFLDTGMEYEKLNLSDLVIENVAENLALKQEILQECEKVIPKHCIYATNTSSFPISKIAAVSSRPDKVVGMHYFMPADKMQLVEVIATDQTSPETVSTAVSVGLQQGKAVIVVRDGPGFYTTRVLGALLFEVMDIFREFQDIARCNHMSRKAGFPLGLANVVDEIGLDVTFDVGEHLTAVFGKRYSDADLDVVKELVDQGCSGRKSGKGFFVYDSAESSELVKDREVNPVAVSVLIKHRLPRRGSFTEDDLPDRLLTRFVNEAVLCLQEGILSSATDGDIGAVFGLGFPPFLGGPFHWVDSVGADIIVSKLRRFETAYGERFTPCSLLLSHAEDPTIKFHQSP